MTNKDGKLSLDTNVNINKVLKNAQNKQRVLHNKEQVVQVEVRRKRGSLVLEEQQVEKKEKDLRLQELLHALKNEEIRSVVEVNELVPDKDFKLTAGSTKTEDVKPDEEKSPKFNKKLINKDKHNKHSKHELISLAEEELIAFTQQTTTTSTEASNATKVSNSIYQIKKSNKKVAREKIIHNVKIPAKISVAKLAHSMSEPFTKVVRKLQELNFPKVDKDYVLDSDTAEIVVSEFGHKSTLIKNDIISEILEKNNNPNDLKVRAPIITIMGHVDHGKTTLLSTLYNIDLVTSEEGRITQHIGAYQIDYKGKKITFIDTPGHAAFSQMRARGAEVTDIIVLVVAANDSVKPQTIEAINHAKLSNVPIVVAINKCDLDGANPTKVKQDLLSHNVIAEDMGGEVIVVEISAQKKQNLDKLMDAILLQAELMELKANPNALANATIIEVNMKLGQGILINAIVQNGTMKIGNIFIAGNQISKIKSIIDDKGKNIKLAIPSQPVQIVGAKSLPQVGDKLIILESESQAQKVLDSMKYDHIESNVIKNIDDLLDMEINQVKKINIVLKTDTHGSAEGIVFALNKLSNENVLFNFVYNNIGIINESDVMLANASNAIIIGFNIDIHPRAKEEAKAYNVDIQRYKIIYQLIEAMESISLGMNENNIISTATARAEIIKVFDFKKYKVAGCSLKEGEINISDFICVMRNNEIIHKGKLTSLKILHESVSQISGSNQEFGFIAKDFNDYKKCDVVYFVPRL